MDLEELMMGVQVTEKHYEWLLIIGSQSLKIDNDHVIERHYCQPGAKAISINTRHGKVHIDFDKLQTLDPALGVQRLSFLPPGQSEDIGWYFRDNQLWREYGSQSNNKLASSISSKDIERQFALNPQGTFSFTVGSMTYNLDFPSMTQTNCSTGMRRGVRRRPKFNSSLSSVTSQTTPPGQNPANGGWKWEFMGEEGVWIEYQSHICAFGSADIEAQYQQNPQGQLPFRINGFSYTLDLQNMFQFNHNTGKRRAVRRTLYDGSLQNSLNPSARWQFLDIDSVWKDYSTGRHKSNVSSQDIELQYQQNPTGSMNFTTNRFTYELNFSAMTQRNLSTNKTRAVRRLDQ
ncbi:uncharacterized protein LOC141810738 [Halichoeres trimaculatus]|uniref:uncharacterized protein LOC141810738 n=1 Tax=Halichoeres trimaculatus TaxID=147232 RepID=UPI003D9E122D